MSATWGSVGRIAGLAGAGVAGFLLASCGGGDGEALTTGTRATVTRPAVTATRPAVTVPTRTEATTSETTTDETTTDEVTTEEATPVETTTTEVTTIEVTTTEVTTTVTEPTIIAPPPIVTVTETQTTEPLPATTVEEPPTTTAEAAEPMSSTDGTSWAWIVVAAVIGAAVLIGLLLWRRRNRDASWSNRLADLSGRCLVALDDVRSQGSIVTGQIQALAAEAKSLETRARDEMSRAMAARLRARLDELAEALESDRRLRLGSPPPSAEQISYSTALIQRHAEQLESTLRPPPAADRPPA